LITSKKQAELKKKLEEGKKQEKMLKTEIENLEKHHLGD